MTAREDAPLIRKHSRTDGPAVLAILEAQRQTSAFIDSEMGPRTPLASISARFQEHLIQNGYRIVQIAEEDR